MFEKSLYDLIRGLRNHKGNERAYIQDSLRECRKEIKSQEMDLKATALLKLTYLEMFGHDMSWASFNVLEVMSSQKYLQKRVGYLSAVQSFRPDTEVLLLAENLLKKDMSSPSAPTISLPLVTIPHVISASMANSLLSDLIPRLSHSNPNIRKKTIVTLYRLALVYPETLRPAWPRIKDRLLDEDEDPSVTAAVVNVVCELGRRRPQDFLPLAPRLFDLLVQGNNNWMAIKIIKLFATLTPLEPRLTRKLLPPLTTIIKTTPAMSLLYECINGIIAGGILSDTNGSTDGDELAKLCVGKLRGMLMVEGDPNLKYVALLAFNRIVEMHPYLVSLHEDAILECIDDADISIRLRALDLVVGMVNTENLVGIVDRLLKQLIESSQLSQPEVTFDNRGMHDGVIPFAADSDDEDLEQPVKPVQSRAKQVSALPDDHRIGIIEKILAMCSQGTYANISDFEWYIEVLLALVRHIPASPGSDSSATAVASTLSSTSPGKDVAYRVGMELRNIAIRVKDCRRQAVHAAEALVSVHQRDHLFPTVGNAAQHVLEPTVWTVGEYAEMLADVNGTLVSLIHADTQSLPAHILGTYLTASVKVFSTVACGSSEPWSTERKTIVLLTIGRMTHFFESLATHADLEVQEQAVEYLELLRLANEAVSVQNATTDSEYAEAPLLLTQAIPSLFKGTELNPVARDAQRKVPVPNELNLDDPIDERLSSLLEVAAAEEDVDLDGVFQEYYSQRPVSSRATIAPALNRISNAEEPVSYQQSAADLLDSELASKRRAERRERYKDDPFYIPSEANSGTATPMRDVLRSTNGEELDIDSIPIMELNLENSEGENASRRPLSKPKLSYEAGKQQKSKLDFEILGDEDIGDISQHQAPVKPSLASGLLTASSKRSLLQVDSRGLDFLSLSQDEGASRAKTQLDIERREAEEAEMALAVKEVERLRLEMQRAQERIVAREEATVVKRKKKSQKRIPDAEIVADSAKGGVSSEAAPADSQASQKPRKKGKKISAPDDGVAELSSNMVSEPKKKKKKKRREALIEEEPGNASTI